MSLLFCDKCGERWSNHASHCDPDLPQMPQKTNCALCGKLQLQLNELEDAILEMVPQECRAESLGALDCLKKFSGLHAAMEREVYKSRRFRIPLGDGASATCDADAPPELLDAMKATIAHVKAQQTRTWVLNVGGTSFKFTNPQRLIEMVRESIDDGECEMSIERKDISLGGGGAEPLETSPAEKEQNEKLCDGAEKTP